MFTVVTDSTAYLTRKQAETLGVRVLPMSFSAGSMPLSEGYLDENGNFVRLLSQNWRDTHTSQVTMTTFLSTFNELLRKGHKILCLTISSRLSGTYGNALIAARELRSEDIVVVDTLSTAGAMRFLVEKACELSRQGATLQEAADQLEGMRDGLGIALSVDDMEALRRSGRLGFVRQSVGTILNIRPILLLQNGTLISSGTARGTNGQIAELVRSVPADAKRIEVHYINRRPAVEAVENALRDRFKLPIVSSGIGPVLTIHLGLSAIGVAWMR